MARANPEARVLLTTFSEPIGERPAHQACPADRSRAARLRECLDVDTLDTVARHLLYVACTRARAHLLVTGVNPASEFQQDLRG